MTLLIALMAAVWFAVSLIAAGVIGRGIRLGDIGPVRRRVDLEPMPETAPVKEPSPVPSPEPSRPLEPAR